MFLSLVKYDNLSLDFYEKYMEEFVFDNVDDSIKSLVLPKSLKRFGTNDLRILDENHFKYPPTLETLKLYSPQLVLTHQINNEIKVYPDFPTTLRSLTLSYIRTEMQDYTGPVDFSLKHLGQLEYLTIRSCQKGIIGRIDLPDSVKHLSVRYMPSSGNSPISLPPNLQSLHINMEIINSPLPTTITNLSLYYCPYIQPGFIPINVKKLHLSFAHVHNDLVRGSIPYNVEDLTIQNYILPNSTTLSSCFPTTNLVKLTIKKSDFKMTQLPPNLQSYVIHWGNPSLLPTEYPPSLTHLTLSDIHLICKAPSTINHLSVQLKYGSTITIIPNPIPNNIKTLELDIQREHDYKLSLDEILQSQIDTIKLFNFSISIRKFKDQYQTVLFLEKGSLYGAFLNRNQKYYLSIQKGLPTIEINK
ncbi:hypothetical protein DFA_00188 [Cavenderia fasciculata]|uniref:FNIP repeat-containing protein n=1 Tax=Cavenderia fasciculata TaxID=261658 RepID=F4PXV0_CACFS|nr:uncharacterized protein DFA_00188 [Cavenderia fasciculata]EGG19610.1 hypothetical protein DFA_00188 [Cavenderia fasciculata]|eukprot:XP_004357904.1 hypothetical protein DFA_00188 [Cavenderia fasciculata]